MAIVDKKKQVMAQVSALNVLTDKMPSLKTTNSFSSINNKTDSIDFLLDLTKSLTGYESLKNNIVDLITGKLPEIDREVKSSIKKDLKELVSCSVNPSVPEWLKSGGDGITVKLSDIDFYEIMKTTPEGAFGNLIYDDIEAGLDSTDYNTFLYNVIRENRGVNGVNGGDHKTWNSSQPILQVAFSPYGEIDGVNVNNVINFKLHSTYDDKTLVDFNNDYLNSIELFDTKLTFNNIINGLFNSIGQAIGKSKRQLEKETEIDHILDCIINADEDVVIDDSYFTFSNEDLAIIGQQVNDKSQGIIEYDTCGNLAVNVPISMIEEATEEIDTAQTSNDPQFVEEQTIIAVSNAVDMISDYQGGLVQNPIDFPTVKVNFIIKLIKTFTKAIANQILSPKLVTLFVINHKIIYGQTSEYDGPIGYMKENRDLIRSILLTITQFVVKMLLTLVLKSLSKKLAEKFAGDEKERSKKYAAQLLSLLGVEDKILRQIQGLNFVTVL